MKNIIFTCLLLLVSSVSDGQVLDQSMQSPSEFLQYPLGEKFTYHHKVLDYFEHIEEQSDKVRLFKYGRTYEGRDLMVAFVSSPANLEKLEDIRKSNMTRTGLEQGGYLDQDIAIVWLSYNVHGNEANSTETSMKVLYELVRENSSYTSWLDSLVVVIDPCLNPDGRDRYVNWYNQVANIKPNPNVLTREHQEGWAYGRTNHYMFDLNRDWMWQTQIESEYRLKLYNDWLPHVHVDFHEQYFNSQYYFAPAAEPYHEAITDWQKEFQEVVGANNMKYFDEKGWLYFTREIFDLLYPGYGDTYPMYNGAIGMTYEMPGHSTGGLAVKTNKGDTLTLSKRIAMHYTTSIATLETCFNNREKLIDQFTDFYQEGKEDNLYYILRSERQDRLDLLAELLDKHKIVYKSGSSPKSIKAYSFNLDESVSIKLKAQDLIIPVNQPKSTLVKVMFEKNTQLSDTLTYDITAWSLPYVYGLDAYQANASIDLSDYKKSEITVRESAQKPYAYIMRWTSMKDAKFLAEILNAGYKLNYSTKSFEYQGIDYNAGTLFITRNDNQSNGFEDELLTLAKSSDRILVPVYSGAAIGTIDLGSQKIKFMKKPTIAMLSGEGISARSFGELWYFFEQELDFAIDIFHNEDYSNLKMAEYDVIVLASGNYSELHKEDNFQQIDSWVKQGGKLILMENAIAGFIGENKFLLEEQKIEPEDEEKEQSVLYPYEDLERENIKNNILGSIIRVEIDNTHSVGYGYERYYYTLKQSGKAYKFLKDGWNIGYIASPDKAISGYIGSDSKDLLNKSLTIGVEHRGRGRVVYFADNPIFRGFWQNGKLFLANAVFFDN